MNFNTRYLSEEFIVPSKKNRNTEKITVAIIGSNPPDGMRSKPTVSVTYLDEKYTLLDAQVSSINTAFPNVDIVLVAGHDIGRIVQFRPSNLRVIENQGYKTCGEVEDIRMALNCCITDKIIIIHNNLLFSSDIYKSLRGNKSTILTGEPVTSKDVLGVIHTNTKVENIAFGNGQKMYNAIYLQGRELQLMKKFAGNAHHRNMLMFEAINYMLPRGGEIKTVLASDRVKVI